jgi:hypothetical protein
MLAICLVEICVARVFVYVESGCWYSNDEANAGEILLEMAGSSSEVSAMKETPTVLSSNYCFGTRSPQTSVGWLGLHALDARHCVGG